MKNSTCLGFVVTMMLIALAARPALGLEENTSEAWAMPEQDLAMDLSGADLTETLKGLGQVVGTSVSIHPDVKGRVTYSTKGQDPASILGDLCTEHRLECSILAGDPMMLRVEPALDFVGFADNISLSLAKAPLDQVLASFETISGGQVEVLGSFNGDVTVEISNHPWPAALKHLCAGHGCLVEWDDEPIRVVPSP